MQPISKQDFEVGFFQFWNDIPDRGAGCLTDDFQAYYGCYQCADKENPCKRGGLVEHEYAENYGKYGSYACPYGISSADGKYVRGLCQQNHADYKAYYETGAPEPPCRCAGGFLHLAKAESEAGLKTPCYYEDYPTPIDLHGRYTLNRKCIMSPSSTTYSFPSTYSFPAARHAASEPYFT